MASRGEVEDGKLLYTCLCGWIDKGHAKPGSATKLWARIRAEKGTLSKDKQWYTVPYWQTMWDDPYYSRAYWVKKGLTKAQQQSVALTIFAEVSWGFEATQARDLIYSFSGFSIEDLVSNLVGFYAAVAPGKDYISLCKPVSTKAALLIWDTYDIGDMENRSFKPWLYPCSECGKSSQEGQAVLPEFLRTIRPAKKGTIVRNWTKE